MLDLSLECLNAYIEGYSNHLQDLQFLGIQGFWVGYYNNSKRANKPDKIINDILRKKNKEHSDDVDVEQFLQMEESFNRRLNNLKV